MVTGHGSGVVARPLTGIILAAIGYCLFSIQDAGAKWLAESYAVPQILFLRSVVMLLIGLIIARQQKQPSLWKSRNKAGLVLRALLLLMALLSFYSASRHLGLADLTALYFAAPVFGVVLAILVLKEEVSPARWLAVIGGFCGVLMVADPSGRPDFIPAAMVLFAAVCWGWNTVLVRLISRSESTANQMIAVAGVFVVLCGAMQPFVWKTPDLAGWCIMLGLGVVCGVGQYLLYEAYRHAPASALAPIEYTGLVFAFMFGYLLWHDIPGIHVFAGSAIIVAASLGLFWWEARLAGRSS